MKSRQILRNRAVSEVTFIFTDEKQSNMVEWSPRAEMGLFSYLNFKLGKWTEVETLPEWVERAHAKDTEGVRLDTGGVWEYTGDSLKYKIQYRSRGQKVPPHEEYFVKIRSD